MGPEQTFNFSLGRPRKGYGHTQQQPNNPQQVCSVNGKLEGTANNLCPRGVQRKRRQSLRGLRSGAFPAHRDPNRPLTPTTAAPTPMVDVLRTQTHHLAGC